jgi:hypothetical protein
MMRAASSANVPLYHRSGTICQHIHVTLPVADQAKGSSPIVMAPEASG